MCIKYDQYDLLELFQSEPISVSGNADDGELIYTYKDSQNFEVVLMLDAYQQLLNLSILFQDYTVFTGEFKNVTELKKTEEAMLIEIDKVNKVRVKFRKQVGVELL
jgi:hypothetical protein